MQVLRRMARAKIGGPSDSAATLGLAAKAKTHPKGKSQIIMVLVAPDGTVYAGKAYSGGFQKVLSGNPSLVVGVYNRKATAQDISEDIEAHRWQRSSPGSELC